MEKRRKQLVAPRALQEHIRNKLIGNEKRKPEEGCLKVGNNVGPPNYP